jgi:hypothetical protein
MPWPHLLTTGLFIVACLVVGVLLLTGHIGQAAPVQAAGPDYAPAIDGCPNCTVKVPTTVTITVTLERPNNPPPDPSWEVPIDVTLYPAGSGSAAIRCEQWTDLMLDQNGVWTGVLTLCPGTYDVSVKNAHTLTNKKANVAINGPTTIDMGTLREGDANDDNQVDIGDFSILVASYRQELGDPDFQDRTDFDEDDRVDIRDFVLLANHFAEAGDQPRP